MEAKSLGKNEPKRKQRLGSLDEETAEAIIRNKVDEITFEASAKRTGRAGKAHLEMRISRAYRKTHKRAPHALRASSR